MPVLSHRASVTTRRFEEGEKSWSGGGKAIGRVLSHCLSTPAPKDNTQELSQPLPPYCSHSQFLSRKGDGKQHIWLGTAEMCGSCHLTSNENKLPHVSIFSVYQVVYLWVLVTSGSFILRLAQIFFWHFKANKPRQALLHRLAWVGGIKCPLKTAAVFIGRKMNKSDMTERQTVCLCNVGSVMKDVQAPGKLQTL